MPVASLSYFVGAGAVVVPMAGLPWRGSEGLRGGPRGRLRDVAGVLPFGTSEPSSQHVEAGLGWAASGLQ